LGPAYGGAASIHVLNMNKKRDLIEHATFTTQILQLAFPQMKFRASVAICTPAARILRVESIPY
jgi:hypothetical protein